MVSAKGTWVFDMRSMEVLVELKCLIEVLSTIARAEISSVASALFDVKHRLRTSRHFV